MTQKKTRLDAFGSEIYGRFREKYFAIFGVPAPDREINAARWVAENSSLGKAYEISASRVETIPSRRIEGAIDQIEPHLETLPEDRREELTAEIFHPLKPRFEPEVLYQIENGRVVGQTVGVITPDNGNLVDVSGLRFRREDVHRRHNYRGGLPHPKKLDGSLGILSYGVCGLNYFHFLIECLPKLRQFEAAGVEVDRFYAPYNKRYMREFLDLMGIGPGRIVRDGASKHLQPERIYAPTPVNFPRRETLTYLYEKMARQPWSKVGGNSGKRVYISRAKAGWRKVLNERELLRLLSQFDFQSYCLEDMSVRQQIQLFQEAEVILGPHGAGLANMVFAPPGAMVIEIGTVFRPFNFFHKLASQCGHDMIWFVGHAARGRKRESHIVVDIAQLRRLLEIELQATQITAGHPGSQIVALRANV